MTNGIATPGTSLRVGIGYDAHRLERGLPLTLGGVLSTDTDVVAVVKLPTLSEPVPVIGCEAPSVETT